VPYLIGFLYIIAVQKLCSARCIAHAFYVWPSIVAAFFNDIDLIIRGIAMHGAVQYVIGIYQPLWITLANTPYTAARCGIICRTVTIQVDAQNFAIDRSGICELAVFSASRYEMTASDRCDQQTATVVIGIPLYTVNEYER
jgi:hypothetical protein